MYRGDLANEMMMILFMSAALGTNIRDTRTIWATEYFLIPIPGEQNGVHLYCIEAFFTNY